MGTVKLTLRQKRKVVKVEKLQGVRMNLLATPSPAIVFQPLSLARLYEYITASITAIVISTNNWLSGALA